jgi:hypothetical protein
LVYLNFLFLFLRFLGNQTEERERFDEAGSGDGGFEQDAKISGGGGR